MGTPDGQGVRGKSLVCITAADRFLAGPLGHAGFPGDSEGKSGIIAYLTLR